ncbi:class I SAM-dependent methyltransferase [Arenibaculum pallidiluteum]|uniref:class I SAM-dependent methyltransferase n=1 Tax=Arenibaculum pallidiluteum TaxID=2812559 RepID=UPI001A962785|nr:class I SAM-dependent methyltransferase [Arenibaculum pallidiluteum]
MTLTEQLWQLLYGGSPFAGFASDLRPDLESWPSDLSLIDRAIDVLQPDLIVEVGSWKGRSAVHMARRASAFRPLTMVCVDTWLGSVEHWLNPEWKASLLIRNGRPRIYDQFMVNVVDAGCADSVVPMSMPSAQAAEILRALGLSIPMVYLDGAHDFDSVRQDIAAWWPLVRPGGILIGDDYIEPWYGVIDAADDFMRAGVGIANKGVLGSKWFAQKEGGSG